MNTELNERIKCLIIGSGPAGYTAAIYTARADLKPVLYTGLYIGGQLTKTSEVENYPGYPDGILGPQMMENFHKQAENMGADLRIGFISHVDFSEQPFKVVIDENKTVLADSIIISTGATPKFLGLESEQKYAGHGVSACATCDGYFFKGEDVAIIGAGDTAAEEALHLSKLCRKVYMIIRKSNFKASKLMVHRVENTPNIEVIFNSDVKGINGDGTAVNSISITNSVTSLSSKIDVKGVFLAIGHQPNTQIFKSWIEMDDIGYIKTQNRSTKTNIPGVFCCGDAQDPTYRQAVTAAGSGCMAALDCERYLLGIQHESPQ